MESCFWAFHYIEEQRMKVVSFLVKGRARKWWEFVSLPIIQERNRVTWANLCLDFMKIISIEIIWVVAFAPHINANSEAKLDHCFQALNQEIIDRVTVCDDPTSYERLVNRRRQAEVSLNCDIFIQSSRTIGTPGLRAQSFKKSASSSSRYGEVFKFVRHCTRH